MLRPWPLHIDLDRKDRKVPVYQQLARKVRELILDGTLKAGEALPGSRVLAQELHVSRKTVVSAMELLQFSGFLVNKERVGLFVAERVLCRKAATVSVVPSKGTAERTSVLKINDGLPDTSIAPIRQLARTYRQLFHQDARWQLTGNADALGTPGLRVSISSMLNQSRELHTLPEEICVTRGSQMALFLVAHTVLQPGDAILVEQPGYERACETFQEAGLTVLPVEVDAYGIKVDQVDRILSDASLPVRAIYLTPRHQYPTMVSLSPDRRRSLVDLIRRYRIYLIEDDYDCDFSFGRVPLLPLSALLPKELCFYIGTFSKMIAPSVRVGFLATAEEHIQRIGKYRSLIDIQGDYIMERAILELIDSGEMRKHIKRAIKYYREKQEFFTGLLLRELSGKVCFRIPPGGLALWVVFTGTVERDRLSWHLRHNGIEMSLVSTSEGLGARIGYASLSHADMFRLVGILKKLL